MCEDALRSCTLDDEYTACTLAFALGELVPGKNTPWGKEEIVARHKWDFSFFITGAVSSLTPKAFNTFRTPVPVWEVINSVLVYLRLRGREWPGQVFARSSLLLRSVDLTF